MGGSAALRPPRNQETETMGMVVQAPKFVIFRHFESTQPVSHCPPLHECIFLTRLRSLLVSLSKMSADISYEDENTSALQVMGLLACLSRGRAAFNFTQALGYLPTLSFN